MRELSGQVRVLSDHGIGLVSNNGGNVLSDHGIGLIANNGAGLAAPARPWRLREAEPPAEASLTDAWVFAYDAEGRVLANAQGRPIAALSGKDGSYRLTATLPDENVVLRVKLARGGELTALAACKGASGAVPVDVSTSSSLGAAYVLDRYVKGVQAVYDKLPAAEALALTREIEAARGGLGPAAVNYQPGEMATLAERLRAGAPAVHRRLGRIEAILLAGQRDFGDGLAATRVPLAFPVLAVPDGGGGVLIAESLAGRIRRVGPDGVIEVVAGAGTTEGRREAANARKAGFAVISSIAVAPDGAIVTCENQANLIRRIAPDGTVRVLLGTGARALGPLDGPGDQAPSFGPLSVAVGPDGTVYVGEQASSGNVAGRLITIDPAGKLGRIEMAEPFWSGARLTGLSVTADGTLWASSTAGGVIARRTAGTGWTVVADGLTLNDFSRFVVQPDGGVIVSETRANRVVRIGPDGTRATLAGSGAQGAAGDGGPAAAAQLNQPAGLSLLPDGSLLVADAGNQLIRRVVLTASPPTIETFAGARGVVDEAGGQAVGINVPGGLAVDPAGRLVIAEAGSGTIKRLENGVLTTIAGNGDHGDGGDGGMATAASLNHPAGIGFIGGDLYVLDVIARRMRRVTASGVIERVAGTGAVGPFPSARLAADAAPLSQPSGLAVGPDGRPYWTDLQLNLVLRLAPTGDVEVVAGQVPAALDKPGDAGDGGPATAARLNRPTALAFDRAGNLYVADSGNLRVRVIAKDGTIATVAGMSLGESLAALSGTTAPALGARADQTVLVGPVALAIDDQDRLCVAEIGSAPLTSVLAGSFPGIQLAPAPPRILRIDLRDPARKVEVLAGPGGRVLADPLGDDALRVPTGLVFDRDGRLVVADGGNNTVKLLPKDAL